MEAVVLAAGEGQRMRPLTLTRPKAVLPVAGEPLLRHVLARAASAGATRAHVIVHHGARRVEEAIGAKGPLGIPVTYQDQGKAGGTGHALQVLEPKPREPFLLLSADALVPVAGIRRLMQAPGDGCVIGADEVADATAYGSLVTENARLVRIAEKSDTPPSRLVNTGTYRLTPSVFKPLTDLPASPRGEIELTDALTKLAEEQEVRVERLEGWLDVSRPWDLLGANKELLAERRGDAEFWHQSGIVEQGVVFDGPVRVETGAHVRTGTIIEGPAIVQAGARVGPLAYIRAHTVIGPKCHIGAHTEIKNSILFEGAHAPHLNYVGDSILGAGVNLGAGTVIANLRHDDAQVMAAGPDGKTPTGQRKFGAVLGDRVKTGINVSLDCGTVIGPGALLAPGHAYWGYLAGDRIHYQQGKSGPKPAARKARPA